MKKDETQRRINCRSTVALLVFSVAFFAVDVVGQAPEMASTRADRPEFVDLILQDDFDDSVFILLKVSVPNSDSAFAVIEKRDLFRYLEKCFDLKDDEQKKQFVKKILNGEGVFALCDEKDLKTYDFEVVKESAEITSFAMTGVRNLIGEYFLSETDLHFRSVNIEKTRGLDDFFHLAKVLFENGYPSAVQHKSGLLVLYCVQEE